MLVNFQPAGATEPQPVGPLVYWDVPCASKWSWDCHGIALRGGLLAKVDVMGGWEWPSSAVAGHIPLVRPDLYCVFFPKKNWPP